MIKNHEALSSLHQKMIDLDRKKVEYKAFMEEYKTTLESLVSTYGLDHCFIDNEGIVYKLSESKGKWVNFDKFNLDRTKRPGEERGSLSVKAAQELGFNIKDKK